MLVCELCHAAGVGGLRHARGTGAVDGISLLCCGKILSYEADGAELMKSFQLQLCDHLADTGIKRIVAACPNCVKALREGLALDRAMRRCRSSRASARYG